MKASDRNQGIETSRIIFVGIPGIFRTHVLNLRC